MTKTLYIVRGCPGDGKTTLADALLFTHRVASDNMPGLYVNGEYQNHLQKQSHVWCQETVEAWMKRGESVIVHNTFTRKIYIKPYLELAKQYGYAVHIIHSEAVVLPNGDRTKTTHGVPQDILDSMRSGFEAFNPIPKTGITPADIAAQMTGLQYPDVIIFDMDKTIKEPHDGRSFPKDPDDFKLTDYFYQWIRDAVVDFDCYVVSNQQGIETGQKTVQFLKDEAELLNDLLIFDPIDCPIKRYYFAPSKKDKITLNLTPDEDGDMRWVQTHHLDKADKPGTEMFRHIYETKPHKVYWIVGDAHADNTATDWQFAQNCQHQFPQLDIRYVPIEMLNVFWSLVK